VYGVLLPVIGTLLGWVLPGLFAAEISQTLGYDTEWIVVEDSIVVSKNNEILLSDAAVCSQIGIQVVLDGVVSRIPTSSHAHSSEAITRREIVDYFHKKYKLRPSFLRNSLVNGWSPLLQGDRVGNLRADVATGWPLLCFSGQSARYQTDGDTGQSTPIFKWLWVLDSQFNTQMSAFPMRFIPLRPHWLLILCNWFAFAAVGLMAKVCHGVVRQRIRRAAGRCSGCGYSLDGLSSGKCPECGTDAPAK
jgi:hypothetical protein